MYNVHKLSLEIHILNLKIIFKLDNQYVNSKNNI